MSTPAPPVDAAEALDSDPDAEMQAPPPDAARDVPDDAPPPDAQPDQAPDQGPLDVGAPRINPCPDAPIGRDVGQLIPEVTLLDCDGNPVSTRSLCEHDVGWIFEYAGWCPPCQVFATGVEGIYQRGLERGDLRALFIISELVDFSPPDAAACARIRERFGLTMPVLIDPDGVFRARFEVAASDVNIVTRRGVVTWWSRFGDAFVELAIQQAFAP